MKPFRQLLLATAGVSLLSPVAVSAQQIASNGGMSAVNEYMNQADADRFRAWEAQNQVTSVTQFSDVRPTDWAYQALSALVEKYGCVAGYPNGTFKGGQPLSRYEAAALLNACLDRVTEITDELKRLQKEFEQELAVLKGRVDGLEAKVGKLEATQFSTTTKLQGEATFVLGGNSFNSGNLIPVDTAKYSNGAFGATSLNYDVRLNLSTSFTGKDLLYTRLRAGNFANNAWNGSSSFNLLRLDTASSATVAAAGTNYSNNDLVYIDRLYYRFPLSSEFTAVLGAKARNTEFLAIQPSFYSAGILDAFTTHGAPGTYNKATGATAGVIWKQTVKKGQPYLGASLNYVAVNGANGNPGYVDKTNTGGGLFGDFSQANLTAQFGVAAPQWALAVAYRYGSCGQPESRNGTVNASDKLGCGNGSNVLSSTLSNVANSNNLALTAAWQPAQGGTWIPSISAGWGYTAVTPSAANPVTAGNANSVTNVSASQSWTLSFQWTDAFVKGNSAGFAFGQPSFATALVNGATPNDAGYAWEWWYRFQVTDKISVTPALYYLSNPGGQYVTSQNSGSGYADVFGALVQTRFKF